MRTVPLGLALAGLLLCLWLPSAAACHNLPTMPTTDQKLKVFVVAKSGAASLSVDGAASDATSYAWNADVKSGPSAAVATLNGGGGERLSLTYAGMPLPPLFLNLSRPIVGIVYVSSTAQQSGYDRASLRVEVWQGDERIGGEECQLTPSPFTYPPSAPPTWNAFSVKFRPETASLDPTKPLELRLTRWGGLSDVRIGTGAPQQSYLEFHGYENDPLATGVYLKERQFVPLAGGEADQPSAATTIPMLGLAGPLAIASVRARGRGPAFAAALLLVSGCLGSGAGPNGSATEETSGGAPVVSTSYYEDDNAIADGFGSISGRVRDEFGIALSGANVVVAGTNLFSVTNATGRFLFANVTNGTHYLEIQLPGYRFVGVNVTVASGKRANLEVAMRKLGQTASNFRPHAHDEFPPDGKKTLWSFDFVPGTWDAMNFFGGGTSYVETPGGRSVYATGAPANPPIRLPERRPVLPGTRLVEVVLTWDTGGGIDELGLSITTGKQRPYDSYDQYFVPRPPDEPIRIALFPDEADPGHQRYTDWSFRLLVPTSRGNTWGPLAGSIGSVHVEITAYRGVMPLEPAHPDHWAGADRIVLIDHQTIDGFVPWDNPNGWNVWNPYGNFVPTGTLEVVGTLSWSAQGMPVALHDWSLYYVTADGAGVAPAVANGTNAIDFTIRPSATQVDQFYQRQTLWRFHPDDGQESVPARPLAPQSPNAGAVTSWTLTAVAVRDPTWVET